MRVMLGSSNGERGCHLIYFPRKPTFGVCMQKYRQFVRRKGMGTPCVPSCTYTTGRETPTPLSRGFTTLWPRQCKGSGLYQAAPGHDKPWQCRAGDVLLHLGAGQAAGFGSHHAQPMFSMVAVNTAPSHDLGQEMFWCLLMNPLSKTGPHCPEPGPKPVRPLSYTSSQPV